jgi:sugar phosphate isomerase/epimerase
MITRRKFIRNTTFFAVGLAALPSALRGSPFRKNEIGLQLYTVRDALNKDLKGTLEKVSRIGYTWLEAAGFGDRKFYGLAPGEFKKMVHDLGMEVISSHVGFTPEQSRQVIDAHLELGVDYLVYPWISMPKKPTRDDYRRSAELFNRLGEECNRAGLKFGYHNHDFEFVKIEDTTGYDIFLNQTDPELVCFEADLYWMKFAGVNPEDYFSNYPGRFDLWHVKDMEDSPERSFAEIGTGVIDFKKMFKLKAVAGMSYFFVEQDACKRDPLESIAISYNNLHKIIR